MTGMDERRDVVNGLSVDEARECLAQVGEERVQHDVLHGLPNPTVQQWLSHIGQKLDEETRRAWQRHQDDEVHDLRDIVRKLAYRYPDEKVHEQLLMDLEELDEHWRVKHAEEPEPGIEYIRRVVTAVRQHPR
jgi:transposase